MRAFIGRLASAIGAAVPQAQTSPQGALGHLKLSAGMGAVLGMLGLGGRTAVASTAGADRGCGAAVHGDTAVDDGILVNVALMHAVAATHVETVPPGAHERWTGAAVGSG